MPPPNVPDQIKAPQELELVFHARAFGHQIYVCQLDSDGNPAWILKAPEADLYDQRNMIIGQHFAGPTWKHNDGSEITAKLVARVDAPDPQAIPWLLLEVTGHTGEGVFSRIRTIQRINTTGGQPPPAGSCNASSRGGTFKSSYSAEYYFYGNSQQSALSGQHLGH